jgi:hypothetical protein
MFYKKTSSQANVAGFSVSGENGFSPQIKDDRMTDLCAALSTDREQ